MLEKLKSYAGYVLGLVILILSALLFKQKKQTDVAESKLSNAQANAKFQEVDHAIKEQETKSDSAVDNFRKLDGR